MEKYSDIVTYIDSMNDKEIAAFIEKSENLKNTIVKKAIHAANEGKRKKVDIFPDSLQQINDDNFEFKIWVPKELRSKRNVLYHLISKHDHSADLKELGYTDMKTLFSKDGKEVNVLDIYVDILLENGFKIKGNGAKS